LNMDTRREWEAANGIRGMGIVRDKKTVRN